MANSETYLIVLVTLLGSAMVAKYSFIVRLVKLMPVYFSGVFLGPWMAYAYQPASPDVGTLFAGSVGALSVSILLYLQLISVYFP